MANQVEVVIGSKSDKKVLEESGLADLLKAVEVSFRFSVISCHRHPENLRVFCQQALSEGEPIFIAGAGMAAALPGAIVAETKGQCLVIGVALDSGFLSGLDALLSQTRTPAGTPVVFAGIGKVGFYNAGLIACRVLARQDFVLSGRLQVIQAKASQENPPEIGYLKSKEERS
jgi:5-(carboxyamino)imidazole ribonucleotide mutase